jgi:hypothetical protein
LVPRANIVGKPLMVVWSWEAGAKMRWSRTFHLVRGYPVN